MNLPPTISLVPLSLEWHIDALQQVYWATPGYWAMYNFPAVPAGQAEHDLRTATTMPGRTLLGIVQRLAVPDQALAASDTTPPAAHGELIGLLDFRLHWPAEHVVSIGMLMVAEPYQRQGIATQAWMLLLPWLTQQAQMQKAQVTVEQFNPTALKFFESVGFVMSGESNRIKVGDKFVRLLSMQMPL